jgi:hypothetical protein
MSIYEGRMIVRIRSSRPWLRAVGATALFGLGLGLAGCADMNDSLTSAFADPAKYDLYDCKRLETERKTLSGKAAELQGLMAKAQSGAAGPVVAEIAYRNEFIAVRGQSNLAEEAWRRNKCVATGTASEAPAVSSAPTGNAKGARSPMRSGSAVY